MGLVAFAKKGEGGAIQHVVVRVLVAGCSMMVGELGVVRVHNMVGMEVREGVSERGVAGKPNVRGVSRRRCPKEREGHLLGAIAQRPPTLTTVREGGTQGMKEEKALFATH